MGCVYKITSKHTDKCYIGSTILKLSDRISEHKFNYKQYLEGKQGYCSSFEILELGIDDIEYETLEVLKEDDDRKERECYRICQALVLEKNREDREEINARAREKIPCPICNKLLNRSSLSRHKKRKHSDI